MVDAATAYLDVLTPEQRKLTVSRLTARNGDDG